MTHTSARLTVWLIGLLLLSLPQQVTAQQLGMLEVSVQVDGLSCPFCAYGLEKKLRKVDNVASLEIYVSEGRAVLNPEPGTNLDNPQSARVCSLVDKHAPYVGAAR